MESLYDVDVLEISTLAMRKTVINVFVSARIAIMRESESPFSRIESNS